VPDELWAEIEPILAELDPPNRVGPKRVSARPIMDARIYRGRTGCQWNRLPKEHPDDSTVHRAFQRWKQAGVFRRLWAVLIERCEDLDGVDWEWQAADGPWARPEKGGPCGAQPDRPRQGWREALPPGRGPRPPALGGGGRRQHPRRPVARGDHRGDALERPEPEPDREQHLALDAGFDTPTGWEACIDHDYSPHIAPRRPEDRPPPPDRPYPARRWVAERAHSWLVGWRGILVRWAKKPENYLGLIQLAGALLWFRYYLTLAPWLRS
jgi:putative transposase